MVQVGLVYIVLQNENLTRWQFFEDIGQGQLIPPRIAQDMDKPILHRRDTGRIVMPARKDPPPTWAEPLTALAQTAQAPNAIRAK